MAKLPIVSSVLYGEEERWAKYAAHRPCEKRVLTMRDLVAPQTVDLFTLHYEMVGEAPSKRKKSVNF
jgi:hypothetical protein